MSVYLGPKEIYCDFFGEKWKEMAKFCSEESLESVESYKKFYQTGGKGEFQNGLAFGQNILMLAASRANVHLVKYIVEHADPKILELRDLNGRTALFHAVESGAPKEKVIACARTLIEAGADMNALADKTSPFDFVIRCATSGEKEKNQLLLELFINYGATHAYLTAWDSQKRDFIGEISVDDDYDKQESLKNIYLRSLKDAQKRVEDQFWAKARVLVNGRSDQNSPLSLLPEDIQNVLLRKIVRNNVLGN